MEEAIDEARVNAELTALRTPPSMPPTCGPCCASRRIRCWTPAGRTSREAGRRRHRPAPRRAWRARCLARAAVLGADRFVYVSCNPTTLAGNAVELSELEYVLKTVAPVDMFPHTHHIETVALFERRG